MSPVTVIITVALYIAVLFAVALMASRRTDNAGFFTGGRRTHWGVAALAMVGAAISGVTFISVPGSVAADGFSYMQMVAGFIVGYMIIAFVLIPLFYRMGVVSLYEYLDRRFGIGSHRTGAWFFFASKMLGASIRAYVICAVLQVLVFTPYGIPFWVNAVILMTLVWLYTRRGGVQSVIWTDLLKTACLIGSVVLCIVFMMKELGMGIGQAAESVGSHDFSRMFFFDDPSDRRYFWKQFLSGIFMVIAMTGLDQDMMQRTLSCRNYRDSQKNMIISIILQTAVIFLFLVLGTLFYIFLAQRGIHNGAESLFPMTDAGGSAVIDKSDAVFSYAATQCGLPLMVGILFVLGLISSTYSAAGSALTALTTSFTIDILDGRKRGDEASLTRMRKRVHTAMAVMMCLCILAFERWGNASVIQLVYTVASYSYGPILGMFGFGILCRREVRDRWVPAVAVAAPVICLILQSNSERWFDGYRFGYEILIINAALTAAGLWLLSLKKSKI